MASSFQLRHINRISFPKKHVLVCEDDIINQTLILTALGRLFPHQGEVVVSVVSGGAAAAGVISACGVDLILLDRDMPVGNGSDLLEWMSETKKKIPVMTFSGIPQNNENMCALGVKLPHLEIIKQNKFDVIAGWADPAIVEILNRNAI